MQNERKREYTAVCPAERKPAAAVYERGASGTEDGRHTLTHCYGAVLQTDPEHIASQDVEEITNVKNTRYAIIINDLNHYY